MEIWKNIKDYPDYKVSDLGNVKSLKFNKERILKSKSGNNGYPIVVLSNNGINKTTTVHRLVAMSFLNHNPCGYKLVVNHINFIRTDNRLDNLEIVTVRENANKKHLKSSSEYTGVCVVKNRYKASVRIGGALKHLGSFKNELEASECYENALIAIKNNTEIKTKQNYFSSKYRGVNFNKSSNNWMARVMVSGKSILLGCFINEIEAAQAYVNFNNK